MMDGDYNVTGDFNTMMELDNLFSTKSKILGNTKKTNMNILLLPYIALWVSIPISQVYGGFVVLVVVVLALLSLIKFKFTTYDYLSIGSASFLAILSLSGFESAVLIPGSYIIFGLLWFSTCLLTIPLTALYSINDYGEDYLSNPLFIKTNRTLTLSWSFAFFIGSGLIYIMMMSDMRSYSGLLSSAFFGLMGLYTKWFKDYYPAYVARGR